MYIVTFRIADKSIGGRSYRERYDGLDNELRQGDGFWYDTTSFFVVGSNEDTYTFGRRLCRQLSSSADMLFTFDPHDMSACYFGTIEAEDVLLSFFPKAIRIS